MGRLSSREEYALARWMSSQQLALRRGQLHPERLAKLDEFLPGWRATKKSPMEDEGTGLV